MDKIPIGSHGPPKLVSNSALFQGEQPCESARAMLALLSTLGISLFSRLGIQIGQGTSVPQAQISADSSLCIPARLSCVL